MKVIIIGDTSVGKSCLLNYYLKNTFNHKPKHTLGVEFGQKFVRVNDKMVKL